MWEKLKQATKGLRTLIVSAVIFLVGLGQAVGALDISPILKLFVQDQDQLTLILCVIPVVFAVLRFMTSTPVAQNTPAPTSAAPLKGGLDEGE